MSRGEREAEVTAGDGRGAAASGADRWWRASARTLDADLGARPAAFV